MCVAYPSRVPGTSFESNMHSNLCSAIQYLLGPVTILRVPQ